MNWMLVAGIGLAGGVVSGLFGIGGAVIIVPALVLLGKLPQHTASGTSLAALLLPVGLLGTLEYYKRGQGNIPYAAILAAGPVFRARVGLPRRCCGGPAGERRPPCRGGRPP